MRRLSVQPDPTSLKFLPQSWRRRFNRPHRGRRGCARFGPTAGCGPRFAREPTRSCIGDAFASRVLFHRTRAPIVCPRVVMHAASCETPQVGLPPVPKASHDEGTWPTAGDDRQSGEPGDQGSDSRWSPSGRDFRHRARQVDPRRARRRGLQWACGGHRSRRIRSAPSIPSRTE